LPWTIRRTCLRWAAARWRCLGTLAEQTTTHEIKNREWNKSKSTAETKSNKCGGGKAARSSE
jgi:hypothetical protein